MAVCLIWKPFSDCGENGRESEDGNETEDKGRRGGEEERRRVDGRVRHDGPSGEARRGEQ